MKCIEVNGKITRVSDEKAQVDVNAGRAKFSPKSAWKAQRATAQAASKAAEKAAAKPVEPEVEAKPAKSKGKARAA